MLNSVMGVQKYLPEILFVNLSIKFKSKFLCFRLFELQHVLFFTGPEFLEFVFKIQQKLFDICWILSHFFLIHIRSMIRVT